MSKRKLKFLEIPEVEEFPVLLLLVEWMQATHESSPNIEISPEKLDDLPSN